METQDKRNEYQHTEKQERAIDRIRWLLKNTASIDVECTASAKYIMLRFANSDDVHRLCNMLDEML